ncbi:MAG: hypothetical protein GWN93_26820 [Deltaproteobacteria bacterium]|nr:hypothetical protein [Deltaproteobacteria bacterium]
MAAKKKTAKKKIARTKRSRVAVKKDSKYDSLNAVDYVHSEGKFGEFEIRKTANGWWGSQNGGRQKLADFMAGTKMGMSARRACSYAGITDRQYEHFKEVHEELCGIIPILKESVGVNAHYVIAKTIADAAQKASKNQKVSAFEVALSQWYAERRMKDDFSPRQEMTGPDGKNLPGVSKTDITDMAKIFLRSDELKKEKKK